MIALVGRCWTLDTSELAVSRMVAGGFDDYTVMSISGHSSTRMLERYAHPTEERKIGALDLPWSQTGHMTAKPLTMARQRPWKSRNC